MNAADPSKSLRLQRVLALISDGAERSTLEIMQGAAVCAVNSCIAELRVAGHSISCRQTHNGSGRIWLYKMVRS